ncbi:MAG: DMT family transporter [Rubrivivax sp.]
MNKVTPRVALLLTVPPLLWAGNAIVGRALATSMPPLLLNCVRWWLALALLLPLGWRALGTPERRAQVLARWKPLALLGLLGVGSYNALQYLALQTSTPINVTLIAASTPLWMLLVGAVGYGVKPRAMQGLGALVSLAGVLVVLSRGQWSQLGAIHLVPGDAWILLAAFAWAIYSWQLAKPPPSMAGAERPAWNWAEFILLQTVFGLVFASAAAAGEAATSSHAMRWTPLLPWALAYVAIGPSILAYRAWGLGVAAAGPSVAAFFSNLTPLFAAVGSAALLGEAPQPYHALAFALIVAGIWTSSRP